MDNLEDTSGASTTRLAGDLGLYFFSGSEHFVFGAAYSWVAHTVTQEDDSVVSILSGVMGPSFIASMGSEPMIGFSFRADVGYGFTLIDDTENTTFTKEEQTVGKGFGARGGIGFGFGFSEEVRVYLMGAYNYIDVNNKDLSPITYPTINVGLIF